MSAQILIHDLATITVVSKRCRRIRLVNQDSQRCFKSPTLFNSNLVVHKRKACPAHRFFHSRRMHSAFLFSCFASFADPSTFPCICAPTWPKCVSKCPKMAQKWFQYGLPAVQDGPKTAKNGPKMSFLFDATGKASRP